jgi:signal transduction histidine kinase
MAIFNRLYVKFYLTIIASLLLVVAVSAMVWRAGPEMEAARDAFEMASGVAMAALADPGAPDADQQKAVERLAGLMRADLALYAPDGRLLGVSGRRLPTPDELTADDRRWFARGRHVWSFRLPDRRTIVVRPPLDHRRGGVTFFMHLAVVALLLALLSYPVVRGLTRRLERLQAGVDELGAGDLSARVEVKGKDEIARVAASFNRAAARIEELVGAHKMLLANASHELRTPLTRLRLGVEFLKANADPARAAGLERDIAELDQLIDEILLTSRLDALQKLEHVEDVDLLALAAEEAARFEHASVSGVPVTVKGDPRLLRRLIRNLIENAERHGAPPIEVDVRAAAGHAELRVADHGQGVPESDRARIFEPFYRASAAADARPGAGLGLALVRQIARRHGGDATVQQTPAGTAFVVRLPLP